MFNFRWLSVVIVIFYIISSTIQADRETGTEALDEFVRLAKSGRKVSYYEEYWVGKRYGILAQTEKGIESREHLGKNEFSDWNFIANPSGKITHIIPLANERNGLNIVLLLRDGVFSYIVKKDGKWVRWEENWKRLIDLKVKDSRIWALSEFGNISARPENDFFGKSWLELGGNGITQMLVDSNPDGRMELLGIRDGKLYHRYELKPFRSWGGYNTESFSAWRRFGDFDQLEEIRTANGAGSGLSFFLHTKKECHFIGQKMGKNRTAEAWIYLSLDSKKYKEGEIIPSYEE